MKKRFNYLFGAALLFLVEVLIAKYLKSGFIRENLGDVLIVIFLYLFLRFIFPEKIRFLNFYILLFAIFTEVLQYFDIAKIFGIKNRILRTMIGSTFDIKDIISYIFGFLIIEIFIYIKGDKMKITDIIFDIDGTIVDTKTPILKTWKKTLEGFGYKFTMDDMESIFGITSKAGLEKLKVDVDFNSFMQSWEKNYVEFKDEAKYFDKVEEMLLELKKNKCRLGIVSSRAKREYRDFFDGFNFEKYFDTIILADDTKRHKPDKEPLEKYLEVSGADRDKCIYIGDVPTDVICANNAKIKSAIIRFNGTNPDTSEANYVFDKPEEILKFYLENK